MNALVIAPHPDDDIIGCGGSMAMHVKQGNTVSIVYMSSGEAGSQKYSKDNLRNIREDEARNAASALGISDLNFLRIPDGYISFTPDTLVSLVNIIRQKMPDVVYVPHAEDLVSDHQITCKLLCESCNRAAGPWFQECEGQPCAAATILAYEVWTPLQHISYIEDISNFMDLKLEALRYHRTQLEDIRYDDAVQGLNRYRGVLTGKGQYCEVFQVIKAGGFRW